MLSPEVSLLQTITFAPFLKKRKTNGLNTDSNRVFLISLATHHLGHQIEAYSEPDIGARVRGRYVEVSLLTSVHPVDEDVQNVDRFTLTLTGNAQNGCHDNSYLHGSTL